MSEARPRVLQPFVHQACLIVFPVGVTLIVLGNRAQLAGEHRVSGCDGCCAFPELRCKASLLMAAVSDSA